MNLQLHNVLSDITGDTGMRIIRAIVAGERDPMILGSYRERRCKHSLEIIAKSLTGTIEKSIFLPILLNRRIRNRMYGGVEAALGRLGLYPIELFLPFHMTLTTCSQQIQLGLEKLSNFIS